MDNVTLATVVVVVVQIATGGAGAYAALKAIQKKNDLLADIVVGKTSIKFDKSDILSIAFAIFVFWAVANRTIDGGQGLGAFAAVISGTGVKELVQSIFPAAKAS
jgi:hypothetical protein